MPASKPAHSCPLCGTGLAAITMESLGKHFLTCPETEWAGSKAAGAGVPSNGEAPRAVDPKRR